MHDRRSVCFQLKLIFRQLDKRIVRKLGIISPTLKKTHLSHEEFKNFRPVCNRPFLSKITERAVAFQLNDHLTVNGLNDVFQLAYKKNHSTESALLRVTNDILRAIDDNSSTILLLLDLSDNLSCKYLFELLILDLFQLFTLKDLVRM